MSKSKDLKEAAVAYKKAGNSYEETGKVFGMSASTGHRWSDNMKKQVIYRINLLTEVLKK